MIPPASGMIESEMGIERLKSWLNWIGITPALGGVSGYILGWAIWQPHGLSFGWLLALSILCAQNRSRSFHFIAFLGYYFAALNLPLASLRDYDPAPLAAFATRLDQLLLAMILAFPYAIFAGGKETQSWRAGIGSIVALVSTAVPPLGGVGLASPLLGATAWFPDFGVEGLLAYLLFFGFCVTILHGLFSSRVMLFLLGLSIMAMSVQARGTPSGQRTDAGGLYCQSTQHCPMQQIMIISYPFGQTVRTWAGFQARANLITRLGETALKENPHARLLVYPEEVAGPLDHAFALLYAHFTTALHKHLATAAIGAIVPWKIQTGVHKQRSRTLWSDGIVLIGQHHRVLIARQPAPVAEWDPLAQVLHDDRSSMPAFWSLPVDHKAGTSHPPLDHAAYGKTHLAALICYEQALVWPLLWTLVRHHPTIILAPESVHWEKSPAIGDLEGRLARAWGRLYDLPVAIAVNLPPARLHAARHPAHGDLHQT